MKKAPALPFIIQVGDYHYFHPVEEILKLANPKIKVQEVPHVVYDALEDSGIDLAVYLGIVYEGRCPSNKTIAEILANVKTEIHELPLGR